MSRKRAIPSKPGQTAAATSRNSASNDACRRRRARERLDGAVLDELWSIWRADPRVPSVKSRRSWAISRNADPRLVDNWFLRRRTCAKKTGQPTRDGSYDLPQGVPKQTIRPEFEAIPDLPSDDTLVCSPDGDDSNDLEASSDTACDDDTPAEGAETSAYKDVIQRSRPGKHRQFRSDSSFLRPSEAGNRFDVNVTLFESSIIPVCNQGRGMPSAFTCILCSTTSAQGDTSVSLNNSGYMRRPNCTGIPDEIQVDSGAALSFDMGGNSVTPGPRLDFSPNTFSELSAIPYLFRTPPIVLPESTINHPGVGNRTIADELGRLVNDGKLDFSFLDAPHPACMKLHD